MEVEDSWLQPTVHILKHIIHFMPFSPNSWRFILTSPSQICLHPPTDFSLGFPTKTLYVFPFCPKNATYHTQPNFPDMSTWMTAGVRETNSDWSDETSPFNHSWQFARYHHHQWMPNHCIQVALYYKLCLHRSCTCKARATTHHSSSTVLLYVINWQQCEHVTQ